MEAAAKAKARALEKELKAVSLPAIGDKSGGNAAEARRGSAAVAAATQPAKKAKQEQGAGCLWDQSMGEDSARGSFRPVLSSCSEMQT